MTKYNFFVFCMEMAEEKGEKSKTEYYKNRLLNMTVEEAQEHYRRIEMEQQELSDDEKAFVDKAIAESVEQAQHRDEKKQESYMDEARIKANAISASMQQDADRMSDTMLSLINGAHNDAEKKKIISSQLQMYHLMELTRFVAM